MTNYTKKIPLEQECIQLIIKAFEDGEHDYVENFREHPTVTRNGRGAAIWNNINTHLVKLFSNERFKSDKISRGPWELIYIFDTKTKYLYTFMRDANFINLHKGGADNHLFHYSNVLSRINSQLLGLYVPQYQQLSLVNKISIDAETDVRLEELLKQMVYSIEEKIERYAIVLVDSKQCTVNKIQCVIPVAYCEPMYCEDWSEFINPEYALVEYFVEETMPNAEESALYELNLDINLSVRSNEGKEDKIN